MLSEMKTRDGARNEIVEKIREKAGTALAQYAIAKTKKEKDTYASTAKTLNDMASEIEAIQYHTIKHR
jgi:hypothetical protein